MNAKIVIGYSFAVLSMLSNVACQQYLSRAFKSAGALYSSEHGWVMIAVEVMRDYRIWIGGTLAGVCLVLWALSLSQLAIARVLPVMALVFVLSPLASSLLFEERLNPVNVIGFVVIVVGVVLSNL